MLPGYQLPLSTRRVCAALKWLTALVAIIYVAYLFTGNWTEQVIDSAWAQLPEGIADAVVYSDGKKLMLIGLSVLFLVTNCLVLFAMFRLFAAFGAGETFSERSVKSVRFLGMMIIVFGIAQLVSDPVMGLALTFDSPPGARLLILTWSSGDMRLLLLGIMFLIIGQIYTQAVRISDENRQIV